MNAMALLLVLTGSILHLGWNILAKNSKDKLAFMWLATLAPALLGIFYFAQEIPFYSNQTLAWNCVFISVFAHVLYFWTLTKAYGLSDLSFVYPICRGVGALFATLLGILCLEERPSVLGGLGIFITMMATFLGGGNIFNFVRPNGNVKGIIFTILTGLAISIYLVADKIGVSKMNSWAYLNITFLGIVLVLAPMMLMNFRFIGELRHSTYRPFIASFFISSAYGVVLAAMKISPVSYVVAARATGIVMSGVAGIVFFSEEVSKQRWISIGLITLGVVFISLS